MSGGIMGGPWFDRFAWTAEELPWVDAYLEKARGLVTLDRLAETGDNPLDPDQRDAALLLEAVLEVQRHEARVLPRPGPGLRGRTGWTNSTLLMMAQFELCLMVALAQWRGSPVCTFETEHELMPGGFIMRSTGYLHGRAVDGSLKEAVRLIASNTSDIVGCLRYCRQRTSNLDGAPGEPVKPPDFVAQEEYWDQHRAYEKFSPPDEVRLQKDSQGLGILDGHVVAVPADEHVLSLGLHFEGQEIRECVPAALLRKA